MSSMPSSNGPHPAVRPLHGTKITELQDACDFFGKVYIKVRGFEPTYIWCLNEYEKLLSEQISTKISEVSTVSDQDKALHNIADMLLRYAQLIEALEKMQNRRVPGGVDDRANTDYNGQLRHVSCRQDNYTNDQFFDLFSNYIGARRTGRLAKNVERGFGSFTNVLGRVFVGTAAGASLLIPMIIMSFETSRMARLIIVSLSTLGFGFTVGVASPSIDTGIVATAAYAAVMVVYIGSADRA